VTEAALQNAQLHAVISGAAVGQAISAVEGLVPPVRFVEAGDLAVAVTPVDSGLDAISARVDTDEAEAIARLEALVRAHEAVVETLLGVTSVVPFRLGLVVRTDEDAVRLLEEHAGQLAADLQRIAGTAEWAVRVWEQPDEAGEADPLGPAARDASAKDEGLAAPAGPARPGTAYLSARRRLREEVELAAARQRQQADLLWHELASLAVDASIRAPVAVPAPDTGDRLLLDAVVLVERSDEERLQGRVAEALARHGGGALHAELTGPWPPYHFVGTGSHG
jgi:hypothetical protein